MNNVNSDIVCAILAGGKNVRMKGRNKAFLKIDSTPLIQKTISLLAGIFDEILIITNSLKEYSTYQSRCLILKDKIKEIGPIGGIYTGLSGTNKEAVFFAACDMPNLHNDLILKQISCFNRVKCDAVIPRIGSLIEPLHSIFRTNLKSKLYDFIKVSRDYSIRSFLKTIDVSYMDLEDNQFHRHIFKNVNTIEEWKEINKINAD